MIQIVYNDGGILNCYSIVVNGDTLVADKVYNVPIQEVERIEEVEE